MKPIARFAALSILLLGCGREAPPAPEPTPDPAPAPAPSAATTAAAKDPNHYGEPFALQKTESLAAVLPRVSETEQQVQVSGTVESVCQAKGCWMILKDGDATTRIFSKDHSFFLPKDIAGRRAVAEGSLKAKEIDQEFAKHLEEDKGGDPSKITGPVREFVMTATAVRLL